MPALIRSSQRVSFLAAVVAALLFSSAPCTSAAQAAAPAARSAAPVPLVAAPVRSLQVAPDGTVTFHLAMPNAVKVELNLEGAEHPFPMAKGTDGAWTVSVPKLPPQYYSYTFNVDGTSVLDPMNPPVKTSFFVDQSLFLVPGQPPMLWEPANVPHGVVHQHFYQSKIVDTASQYFVYTPPGFDAKKKYPVLYLLHGYSDDPSAWTLMGKANVILDNLIAQGKARPMIVVMPWGYGDMQMITRGWMAWQDPQLVVNNFTKFSDALMQEVIPMVKSEYPISDKREDHAIAGLSMGGGESVLVGLNHLDDFAYVGAFSSAVGKDNYAASFPGLVSQTPEQLNSKLKLIWVACGTEDGLFPNNQNFVAWLKEKGLRPSFNPTPGRHVWMLWRENLSALAPLLFQPK
jgi:enterochelin esterase-like enzyme